MPRKILVEDNRKKDYDALVYSRVRLRIAWAEAIARHGKASPEARAACEAYRRAAETMDGHRPKAL